MHRVQWPDGKAFAFTVVDDTDFVTLDRVRDVYAFLDDIGMRTTKTVWPLRGEGEPIYGGLTCEDAEYRSWVLGLQRRGFEIALHNVTYCTSARDTVIRGLDRFRELFGQNPCTFVNHAACEENMYWGDERLSGIRRTIFNLTHRNRRKGVFKGHVEGHRLFWGDLCRDRVRYMRNFAYMDINTLRACPQMPYYDPDRPYVNAWFASSAGGNVGAFNKTITEANQDRLAEQGGACIMYAHLARDFSTEGRLDPRFRELMQRLTKLDGWFVPACTLLDYLVEVKGRHVLTPRERRRLERSWLLERITHRGRG